MKNNKGFSLVELIVVIAIMAILAAVAVVGVSVYIPKAQQANDEQMIADIKYAISLYTSGETLTPGQSGYVVVHKNGGGNKGGNVSIGGAMEQTITDALVATYGNGYTTELKVAYQGWTGTLNPNQLGDVINSSFVKDTDDLLEKVQLLTDKVVGYGMEQSEANQLTMNIAGELSNLESTTELENWWNDGGSSAIPDNALCGIDGTTALACAYARLEAMVLYAQNYSYTVNESGNDVTYSQCDEGVESIAEVFQSGSDYIGTNLPDADVATLYSDIMHHASVCNRCMLALVYDYQYPDGEAIEHAPSYFQQSGAASVAGTDAKAFISLMGQVDQSAQDIKDNVSIDSENFYSSDYVKDVIGGYKDTADILGTDKAVDGDIVIIVRVNDKGEITYKCYPVDY